jgi:TRAP transporter 4TM/12TM fusion protein
MSIIHLLFDTGTIRSLDGLYGWFVKIIGAGLSLAVIWVNLIVLVDMYVATIILLSVVLGLVFLQVAPTARADAGPPGPIDLVLSGLGFACGLYFSFTADAIMIRISLFDPLTLWQQVFGILLVVLTFEATRRTVGLGLTVIVGLFIVYNLFGDLLPGVLGHGRITIQHALDMMFYTTDGIFGVPVRVALTYAYLFVLFGTVLNAVGGGDFFLALASAATGRSPGGPAKVAVVSSGLYGMFSGSPTSDVVTTGSMTIPMMKRIGISAKRAAAIEVTASTGGSLMPPVMGSAAFIMAEFTGIEYREIVIAAIIPALLYYLGVYTQVHALSRRGNLGAGEVPFESLGEAMRLGWIFIIPLAVILVTLWMGYGPSFVAGYGTGAVFVVALFSERARRGLFKSIRALVRTGDVRELVRLVTEGLVKSVEMLAETARRTIPVVAACAAAGLVIGGLSMTGLSMKLSNLILLIAGDSALMTLILAACVTIILGMGMPTPSAYILAAILVAPALLKMDFGLLEAHMFLLYFAVLSAITPPVAVAAYAAAAIAGGNPVAIAATAVRFAIAAFVVPFGFAYAPTLLMQGTATDILPNVLASCLGVLALAASLEGFLFAPLSNPQRLIGVLLGTAVIVTPGSQLEVFAPLTIALLVWIAFTWQRRRLRYST